MTCDTGVRLCIMSARVCVCCDVLSVSTSQPVSLESIPNFDFRVCRSIPASVRSILILHVVLVGLPLSPLTSNVMDMRESSATGR